MVMMILVTTAGKVGAAAGRLLAQRGEPVWVLVRDPAKAAALAAAGAEVAEGDADYVTDDVPSILGRPARTFQQFATDYVAAFS
jgi:nucleoside-diphosphate-sugar epimerase